MGLFPEAYSAQLADRDPRSVWLIMFDFASGPMRVWLGYGELDYADGSKWFGLGHLASVSGIEQVVNATAPEVTFELNGCDASVATLLGDEWKIEAYDRKVTVSFGFVGDDGRGLDSPWQLNSLIMKNVGVHIGEDKTRSLTLKCETGYALRSRTPGAMYTDADQHRRFAGDKGFSFVAKKHQRVWPDY